MNNLLVMLLEQLPRQPRSFDTTDDPGFWSDGEMILCPTEAKCEFIADFLQDLFHDATIVVQTGYFDPFEDHNNGESDDYTGFYYISFE